jgi:thioredoxin-dependent peroxiredoxin
MSSPMIAAGSPAPDFQGLTAEGRRIGLADFKGKQPLVLFFYPKDNTPVCTKEVCMFRDRSGELAATGAAVLGVSMDSAASHQKFGQTHGLTFPLVSDRDGAICKAYGVARLGGWLPAKRVTFVIDRNGVVRRVIASEFNAAKHVDDALAALQELGAAASS